MAYSDELDYYVDTFDLYRHVTLHYDFMYATEYFVLLYLYNHFL